jgi:hypothetical protein
MGVVAVTAANSDRILFGQEWLKTKAPAEEVLIIGSTLAGANEVARSVIREKRAAFGYHRLSWGQFAWTLARPLFNGPFRQSQIRDTQIISGWLPSAPDCPSYPARRASARRNARKGLEGPDWGF